VACDADINDTIGSGLNKASWVLPLVAAFAEVANATVSGDASPKS
jgi:hypothetical protein